MGQGDIDIKGIVAILKQSNYSGVYVIETDVPTKKTMYESNLISRQYLREQVGIENSIMKESILIETQESDTIKEAIDKAIAKKNGTGRVR